MTEQQDNQKQAREDQKSSLAVLLRAPIGGVLMGLANLVPGISGGTMLLASGIYPDFIDAISKLTRFKFELRSILLLATVIVFVGLAIVGLAGPVRDLVIYHRWMMYSLFIGLTLGGVPIVWKLAKPIEPTVYIFAFIGFVAMAAVAVVQMLGIGTSGSGQGSMFMLFVAGLAGASAMILPGVSGGYLLLILGQYVPVLDAIDSMKDAVRAKAISDAAEIFVWQLLPVGIGVIAGIVGVSNLIEWLLKRFKKATLGFLLGLLFGAVMGLWPFHEPMPIVKVTEIKGQAVFLEPVQRSNFISDKSEHFEEVKDLSSALVYANSKEIVELKDYPTQMAMPNTTQIFSSLGLILLGFIITAAIALLGKEKTKHKQVAAQED